MKSSYEELIKALEQGYPKKYASADLKELISKIIQSTIPAIAKTARETKGRDLTTIWEKIKKDERIRETFARAAEIDRAVAIYVASKFENNRYIGSSLVQAALEEAGGS